MKEQQYDDCAICQAMNMAEKEGRGIAEQELVRAFREQKQMGMGDVWLNDDSANNKDSYVENA